MLQSFCDDGNAGYCCDYGVNTQQGTYVCCLIRSKLYILDTNRKQEYKQRDRQQKEKKKTNIQSVSSAESPRDWQQRGHINNAQYGADLAITLPQTAEKTDKKLQHGYSKVIKEV